MLLELPYRKFVIHSCLNKAQVMFQLRNCVSQRQGDWPSQPKTSKTFAGKLLPSGFEITKPWGYRNSFIPIINGTFEPHENGTKIVITMKLHSLIFVFIAVWAFPIVGIGFFTISSLIFSIITANTIDFELVKILLAMTGMLLFLYLMVSVSFNIQANKASKILYELLS